MKFIFCCLTLWRGFFSAPAARGDGGQTMTWILISEGQRARALFDDYLEIKLRDRCENKSKLDSWEGLNWCN